MDSEANKQMALQSSLVSSLRQKIRRILESEKDTRRAFNSLTKLSLEIPNISSATLFLPSNQKNSSERLEIKAQAGSSEIPSPSSLPSPSADKLKSGVFSINNELAYFDVRCLNTVIGHLGIKHSEPLKPEDVEALQDLAWATGVIFERQKLISEILVYRERIEVLSDLNQMVVSGTNLSRISKTLSRDVAYRFGADSSLLFFLNENQEELVVEGAYGFPKEDLPTSVPLLNTLMSRSLRIGGMFSIPDLASQEDHGLDFLEKSGINCIHSCTLDLKGKTLGTIVIGFRKQTYFSVQSALMLQEYAQGAAVALENSLTQDRLSTYTEKLEELVQTRTADLAVQMSKSEEESKAKSRFVANMSHELRTPLTAIVGYTSVLKDGIFGEINDKQLDALTSIAKSSEHLQELIDEVLNLSKIEAGKDTAEPSEVELTSLLKQTYKLMLQNALSKGLEFKGLPDDNSQLDRIKLYVDPRHIRQILINLISNAIKYTPKGGSVELDTEVVGDKIKISVIDNGVGISEEQQIKLFSRFERGDDSYSQEQKGTGIGLSLTKRIVELNGGKIGVESVEGKGSTFWILMPLAEADSLTEIKQTDETRVTTDDRLDGLNILVVDDNEATCLVLEAIVEKSGGKAYTASTVKAAKEIVQKQDIDAALIDLAIPGESGIDLMEHIRKNCTPPLSGIPLIVVSACVFDSDRELADKAGASEFIAKPFRPEEILQAIREQTTSSIINTGAFQMPSNLDLENDG